MATITKKTRSTKATGAALPAELSELRKTISEISDADLTCVRGGIYSLMMM